MKPVLKKISLQSCQNASIGSGLLDPKMFARHNSQTNLGAYSTVLLLSKRMTRLTDVRCLENGLEVIEEVSSPHCQKKIIATSRYHSQAAAIYVRLQQHLSPACGEEPGVAPVRHGLLAARNLPNLYNGTCGVAIFLAAFYSVTKNPEAAKLARQCVRRLQATITQLARQPELLVRRKIALGGFVGLGSFVYTFVRLSLWLEEPSFMRSAAEVVELLTPALLQTDEYLDVLNGCAGMLAVLLLLARQKQTMASARSRTLDLARACGEHLLARRKPYSSGHHVWAGSNRPPLTGFAHGAAGVGYALLLLFAQTGDERFRAAALEGYAFERALFDPERKNWLDPRTGALLEQSAWCHGAPGILLSRLGSLSVVDDPEITCDLEQTLAIVQTMPLARRDHLCCGNFGRAEVLLAAWRKLRRQELLDRAVDVATRVLERTLNTEFCFERAGEAPTDPYSVVANSLFCGLAGVGYSLLRLAYPTRFPCLLMLE
jgi:type 2 lantibiotic biosynthesis protein LanM